MAAQPTCHEEQSRRTAPEYILMTGLRFCMVTTFYPPFNFGGDGMGIQRFAQALVRRGHEVTILQDIDPYNVLSEKPVTAEHHDDDGVSVTRLHNRFEHLSVLLTQQAGRPVLNGGEITRFFEQNDFDIINFHNISLVGGPGILAYGQGIKLYMAHEHWLICPNHVLWRHNRELCTGRECFRCSLHYKRPPQFWRYTGYLKRELRHVDSFIAMSEFSKNKHREFGFDREMEVVNYFLPDNEDRAEVRPGPPPSERPYFLFVGRLEKIKGLDDVIPVFRNYTDADLLIAGDGEYAPTLKRLASGIPNVRFLGRLTPNELTRYYQHALALIVPSVCFETFGIILIEAFRQSIPVIARRMSTFPEIIDRCQGGVLFGNPDELVGAMARIQTDPSYRDQVAKAAHEGFQRYWSESAVIPKYLEVVRRAALRKGRLDIARKLEE